jgi:DNA-binding transcriptional MerR regulator/methylmalonyl-CoA mutase cobalamin-binding subunit
MRPQASEQVGVYRIQTVARMTGVPIAVLRAWEKRYGVPHPSRTGAAYRMYTEADVTMVRRLSALRASGLAASEAARMVLIEDSAAASQLPPPTGVVERLLDATRRMDGHAIDEALASLATVGNAADAFERVIAPTMVEVGRLWQSGELGEAHEHLLSEHVSMTLRTWLGFARPASPKGTALIGCFADELHTIPAYGLALRWSSYGLTTVLLGARTTPDAVRTAIGQLTPTIVGLSLTMPATEQQAACLPEYAAACGKVPWVVGGPGIASILQEVLSRGGRVLPASFEAQKAWLDSVSQGRGRVHRR